MENQGDVERLATTLLELKPSIGRSTDPAWTRCPALKVLDCVLSLNRNYDSFVVPRLDRFEVIRPEVKSVIDLLTVIEANNSPNQFVIDNLNYHHKERAGTLYGVTKWLASISKVDVSSEIQLENLKMWAANASPIKCDRPQIRGFGLAGFQYLRMLFDANTTKPDIYICRFVEKSIGRHVDPMSALKLLELAAQRSGVRLRDLDTTIWEAAARHS